MIFWRLLILGVLTLILSAYCFKWHNALNQKLNENPKEVEYSSYFISGYGAYLLLPAGLFIVGVSIHGLLLS